MPKKSTPLAHAGPIPFYAVIGRIPYDDEDSCYCFQCPDQDTAVALFNEKIYEDSYSPEEIAHRQAAAEKDSDALTFINHILQSQSPILHETY